MVLDQLVSPSPNNWNPGFWGWRVVWIFFTSNPVSRKGEPWVYFISWLQIVMLLNNRRYLSVYVTLGYFCVKEDYNNSLQSVTLLNLKKKKVSFGEKNKILYSSNCYFSIKHFLSEFPLESYWNFLLPATNSVSLHYWPKILALI